jgi:NACalpha-BTF3-like transcription factor
MHLASADVESARRALQENGGDVEAAARSLQSDSSRSSANSS